jgi:DNA-binding NarL/FixJ family response regulator
MDSRPTQPNSVLLVDDHPDVLRRLTALLAGAFDIVGALPDGRTLLQSVDAHPPDLLVLDITLPGASGIDLARQVAARPVHPGIVMLTVHSDPDYLRAAFAAGASAYVVKSRLATDLVPALRAVLAGGTFSSPLPPEEEGTSNPNPSHE